MLKFATLTITLLATAPVLAQATPAPAQQTAAAGQKPDPLDKIICRTEDTVGSRLKAHRVCATLREWKDQEEENRLELDRMMQGQGVPPSSG